MRYKTTIANIGPGGGALVLEGNVPSNFYKTEKRKPYGWIPDLGPDNCADGIICVKLYNEHGCVEKKIWTYAANLLEMVEEEEQHEL